MFKKIALCLGFTLFLGLLSACSPEGALHLKNDESLSRAEAPSSSENNKNGTPGVIDQGTIGAPVALPPSYDSSPAKPGEMNSAYMPNGLPALQPMKGVNVDQLFSEKISNTDERFNRLENAVLDMRKEFESVKPSIVRLAAVETDIQSLVKEMDVMLQETPPAPSNGLPPETDARLQVGQLDPKPAAPLPLSPENQEHILRVPPSEGMPNASGTPQALVTPTATERPKENPAPAKKAESAFSAPPKHMEQNVPEQQYDGIVAKNIRIGEYPDKVRVVLDTNQKTPFTIELDNDEKLIIVEIPNARWVGGKGQKFADTPLLDSYSIEETNSGKGTMIVIALKKGTEILKQSTLLPDQNPNHRIYFDLKR